VIAEDADQDRQIVVVGTEDTTEVSIVNGAGAAQVSPFNINKGQAYRYATANPIVGWKVEGSKPIAVIAGTTCTTFPAGACDMTAEQLAPVHLWSKDYVAGPGFRAGTVSIANHVVVARDSSTYVTITPSTGSVLTKTLAAREAWMFATGVATQYGYYISADKPVGVVSNIGVPFSNDPTLVTWPPVDGYVSETKMPTSGINVNYANSLTLITRTSTTGNIRVGTATPAAWVPIGTTGYSFTRYDVGQGDNSVTGLGGAKFAAIAMGGEENVSYGYSSPYNIGTPEVVTTCYLGSIPPDFEKPFSGSPECDQDDKSGIDDEDAISGTLVIQRGGTYTLTVPCHDDYFGESVNATVHGFIDFDHAGTFTGARKHAQAPCIGSTRTTAGTATLKWDNPLWGGFGYSVIRLRICEQGHSCSTPTGLAQSGEVEDHRVRIWGCGDGVREFSEACDDGNDVGGDGCSTSCAVEPGFTCSTGNPSVCSITKAPTIVSPMNGYCPVAPWTPTIAGECVAGMTVTVMEGTSVHCTTTCQPVNAFSCTGASGHDPGSYYYVATQSSGGKTSPPSNSVNVSVIVPANKCWIDGELVDAGAVSASSGGCLACDPWITQEGWAFVSKGTACDDDGNGWTTDECDGIGNCIHTETGDCYIDGQLRGNGSDNPFNLCEICDSDESVTSWTPKPSGTSCHDDGNPWTTDECDSNGNCIHTATGECYIDGQLRGSGTDNPFNPCEICYSDKSVTDWTPKPNGTACPDDGKEWTVDVCYNGICTHEQSGNHCTKDSDCPNGEECVDHQCVPEPDCKTAADCSPGQVCADGVCVSKLPDCTSDEQCGPNHRCIGGICQNVTRDPDCETDDQCGEGNQCVSGECRTIPPECKEDSECPSGKCSGGECEAPMRIFTGGCGCSTVGTGYSSIGGISGLLGLLGLASMRVRNARRDDSW